MDTSWPFLVRACLSSPPSLHAHPFFLVSSFSFLSRAFFSICDPLNASLLSLAQRPPSQHAGQLLWPVRPLSPAHAELESRGCGRCAAKGAGRDRPSAAGVGGAGSRPPLLYLRLRWAAAEPVGTEETRWRCGRCGGSWTGPHPNYPCPPVGLWWDLGSKRWQLAGTTFPSLASVSIREKDESCLAP